ncbi:MAG: hypothetical protein HWE27_00585 [Gammaproteobacteria bacterium]|nr:hypothetical protein [Gammaproteobacteria bacterium]
MRQFFKVLVGCGLITLYSNFCFAATYQKSGITTDWLGRGVESASGVLKQNCLSGEPVKYTNQHLSLGFQNKQSISSSIREIDGKISGDVNLGLFGGGATVQLHSRMVENSNTISAVLRINYTGSTFRFENRTYSAFGESLIGQTPHIIQKECGDEYIDHIQLGNDVYFISQLVFDDKEEYQEFVTKIRVRVLFFKTEKTRTKEFYEYAKNARYTIKVLSSNPLPELIKNQLNGSDEIHCGSSSADDIEFCDQASDAIMDYFLSENGYAQWLNNEDNLGVTFYKSSQYGKTGHQELAAVTPLKIDEWLLLDEKIKALLSSQYQLLNVYQSFAEVPVAGQSEAITLRSILFSNIGWLDKAKEVCADAFVLDLISQCRQSIDNAISQQQPVP